MDISSNTYDSVIAMVTCNIASMTPCRTIQVCQAYGKNIGLIYIYGDYNQNCLIETFDETTQIVSAELIKEIFQHFNIPINESQISQFEQYMNNFLVTIAQTQNPEVRAEDIMSIRNFLLGLAQSLQQYLASYSTSSTYLQDAIDLLQSLNVKSGDVVLGEHRNILSEAMYDLLLALSTIIIELQSSDYATGYDTTNPLTGQSSYSLEETEAYIVDSARDFPVDAPTFYLGIAGEFALSDTIEDSTADFPVDAPSFDLGIDAEIVQTNTITDSAS